MTATYPPRTDYSKPFVPLDVDEHTLTVEWWGESHYRNVCVCTFASAWWAVRHYPDPATMRIRNGCPYDSAVRALTTLQFANGGLFDSVTTDHLIHLVRSTNRGTPGPTLCGIDRFAKGGPGWSVGGGVTCPGIVLKPCDGCADTARREFPGLPVTGSVGGAQMAQHLGVEHSNFPW